MKVPLHALLCGIFVAAIGMLGGCPADGDSGGTVDVIDHRGDGPIVDVDIINFEFNDKIIRISAGQTVRWLNLDVFDHTVTSGSPEDADAGSLFDSGLLAINDGFEHLFNEVGEFRYYCRPHDSMPSMRDALVIVEP